jgi:integrase/recombinase XerD
MPKHKADVSRVIGPAHDPASLYRLMLQYLGWMREKNYSEATVFTRTQYLRYFVLWCDERGLERPTEITRPILERYQRYMFLYRKSNGNPLSAKSQSLRVSALRGWFTWLTKNNRLLYNPAADLELPRTSSRLPRHTLNAQEAEQVLNVPDTSKPAGVRLRAMLETLYSTGMRRLELIQLSRFDIDTMRGTVMIRHGKGDKDRVIPIGERALAWIQRYSDEVRPGLALAQDCGALFLSDRGEPFKRVNLTAMVKKVIQKAQVNKPGSCHLFRHTMATLMLENGADIRFIQAMLGHAELSTTQIYTQVSIVKLKEIHTLTHPARLRRVHAEPLGALEAAGKESNQNHSADPVADLLAVLDEEARAEAHDDTTDS